MEEIQITKAQPEHTDQILRLLRESFVTYEPLCVAVGYTWDHFGPGFGASMGSIVDEGLSFVALNPSGRVVGCRISHSKHAERDVQPEPDYMPFPGDSPKDKFMQTLFRSVTKGWTKMLPEGDAIFEFVLMCVEDAYGGRGIAGKLVQRSLALAEQMQVDHVSTIATNWKTQKIFDKLGFVTMATKQYSDFLDQDGNEVMKMRDGSTCMKWMIKTLRK